MIQRTDPRWESIHHYQEPQEDKRRWLKPNHQAFILWHVIAICFYLCSSCSGQSMKKSSKFVDLSHVFDNTTIYWITERPLTMNVTHNGTSEDKSYWYQKEEIYAATHGGTHMDAPCHFALGRWCVSDIPLKRLIVPAVVVDISHEVQDNPNVHLTKHHLLMWEKQHGNIPNGSVLLIHTGWSQFWPDRLKYAGTTGKDISKLQFPSITPEVAEWIIANNRDIVGIGIDTMSLDVPATRPRVHVTLMEKNIYGLENVNNINMLPSTGANIYVMPMKLRAASGAPCRILAEIQETVNNGQARISYPNILVIAITMIFLFNLERL